MGVLIGVGDTVPQFPYKDLWYGILINLKNHGHCVADGKLQRVGNLELHRSLPVQSRIKRFVANADGSVNYWLGANDSTVKEGGGGAARLNGLDGDVMLYKPNYYRKFEFIGTDYLLVAISEVELPGFTLMKEKARSPWYATFKRDTNIPASACFLQWNTDGSLMVDENGIPVFTSNAAQYRGGSNNTSWDGTYRTQVGTPASGSSKNNTRSRCVAKGANWHHGGWRFREEMGWLMAIEFGDLDSQAAYNPSKTADGYAQGGLGTTYVDGSQWGAHNSYYPFIPCGITAKLGNNTGVVQYKVPNWAGTGATKDLMVASYRGWETPHQYLWEHCDDVIVRQNKPSDGGEKLLYLCSDPTKFTTPSDKATAVPDGYVELGRLPDNDGYISAMGVANGYTFPSSVTGGAANKDYCDYYWRATVTDSNGAEGFYQLIAGAHAHHSEDAGVRCAYTGARGAHANAHYGFPLCLEYPLSEGI